MNINDVEIVLSISNEEILMFENIGILVPFKNADNQKEYTWEDILLLKLVLELSSIRISYENIKQLVKSEIPVKECLDSSSGYTKPQLEYIEFLHDAFNNNKIRRKAYFGYKELNVSRLKEFSLEEQLIFKDSLICLTNINGDVNKSITIDYNDIKEINFMIVNRAPYTGGFKTKKKFGIPLVYGGGIRSPYFIDLEIVEENLSHKFESANQDNIVEIFELCIKREIPINDPLHLYDIFKNTESPVERMKFFERHYKNWATEYYLENPRKEDLAEEFLLQKKIRLLK